MATAFAQFIASALIIVAAAVVLTRYADAIAELTRLGRLLVGSIFLAVATSLPELTIDLNAILLDLPDMAVGGLVGSSLFNLMILAIADLAHRTRGMLFSRAAAAHPLSGTVSIALIAIVGLAIFIEPRLGASELFGLGPGAIALMIAYLFGMRLVFFDQQAAEAVREPTEPKPPNNTRRLTAAIAGYVGAALIIFMAAPFLAKSAARIAELTGLGDTFVGTTLVALSTSLPELVATITAIRMGSIDLAIGNIFGSNTFNMLLLVPLDLAHSGSLLAAASETHILTCLSVVLITSVVILGQLYRVERRVLFVEPDAALVIALVIVSLLMVYIVR
jgi:cation:H+ antiporter